VPPNKQLQRTLWDMALSVNNVSAPRICIGKKFQSTAPTTALPANIAAVNRKKRLSPADNHTPSANAPSSRLDMVNSGTAMWLVGAPIANNSLTA
jgi:hypothetical protein